ncbi:phage protein Gp36 family protein [Stenotrophomonas sp. PS02298]|uniref:gp436 family protein n=1 Tax=Stenotrophomonas sp. PS02298 TaxID=2991424 RepID=UPI00249B8705|nr:phage protein Gp36 family protein [Stenotrophomonas sp. PS02298]
MSYATQADLVARFGETEIIQLSDRDNAGEIDAVVVAAKLADADAEIDAYLATRYSLPLATVPTVLKRVACDVARYHLFDDRATDDVRRRYEDALKFLQAVAKGLVSIGVDPVGQAPASTDLPEHCAPEPVFNRSTLGDFLG